MSGVRHISEETTYYKGPSVGYTDEELERELGRIILDFFDANDLQIVWKARE